MFHQDHSLHQNHAPLSNQNATYLVPGNIGSRTESIITNSTSKLREIRNHKAEEIANQKLKLIEHEERLARQRLKVQLELIESKAQADIEAMDETPKNSTFNSNHSISLTDLTNNISLASKTNVLNPQSHQSPDHRQQHYELSEHKDIYTKTTEPCDAFIDQLIEYEETYIPINPLVANRAIQIECESRHLPPINLKRFDGNSLHWPEFIQNFKVRIHSKTSFNDTIRMERLLSVLDGEAKKAIESIGTSSIFYATALKTLKRDFGNSFVISHLKLNELFNKPQVPANNRELLRNYHQQLKTTMAWFRSMGYETNMNNTDNLAKAVGRLPNQLRSRFYKKCATFKSHFDLRFFEKWLNDIVTELYNPLATILSASNQESKPVSSGEQLKRVRNFQANRYNYSCWLCSKDHKVSQCPQLTSAPIHQRQEIVRQRGLCFNCLSNTHQLKQCLSKRTCSVDGCGKKHNTLLHRVYPDQNPVKTTLQTTCNRTSLKSEHTFLQIIPVLLTNGQFSVKTNAILDSGSDSTLIRTDTANALNLNGKHQPLKISNVMNQQVTLPSKKVSFMINCVDSNKSDVIEEAWVIDKLDVPKNKIEFGQLKRDFPHLRNIYFPEPYDGDVTILIGADSPHLLLHERNVVGEKNQPIAVKTKLGWKVDFFDLL